MLYVILPQVYSLMLTVSKHCEDSVTDNDGLRSSGWVWVPQVSELLSYRERGRQLRSPRSATFRGSSALHGSIHSTGSRRYRISFSSLLRVPKNFRFFAIVLSNKDIISIYFFLSYVVFKDIMCSTRYCVSS